MSRLLWVGAGAIGGIYAYRKGQDAWEDAKARGVTGSASVIAAATSNLLAKARHEESDPVGAPTVTEHVIQLPVEHHQPGMIYQVRAIPAPQASSPSQSTARRDESRVARLASWRSRRARREEASAATEGSAIESTPSEERSTA